MNAMINQISNSFEGSLLQKNENANIQKSERMLSLGAGAFIGLSGLGNLFSHPLRGLFELGIGGALVYRGMTGFCHLKAAMTEQQTGTMQHTDTLNQMSASEVNNRIDPEVAY